MSSTTRQLQSINGVTVTPPTQTGFTSNTMEVYPDDAAFLVAHPTPTEGQFYWNSTEKLVRQYNGTSFQYDKTAFSVQTDSTSTGADQDITPTAGSQVIRFTGGSLTSIRGINPALQKQVFLVNDQAANGIVLRNESAGATAANRIRTGNGQDITLRTNQTASLLYDTATSRWRVLGLSNVRSVEAFVNDAAFAAAHAPPVIGDRYWNTTDLVLRQFDGAAWSNNKVSFSTQVNAALTGANQDLVPNLDQIIRLTNGSLTSIRSISPAIQKLIYVVNGQASPITLKNEDATATAANRIATPTGSDFSLAPGQALALVYETGSSRWRFAGGGGGGGLTPIAASGALTAQAGFHYLTDTTAAAFSITLPAGATGATLKFTDATEKWGTNNLTLIPATGEKIDQLAINETLVCDVVRGWVELNWSGTYWAFNSLASTQVAEASATSPGIVSTGAQSFAGAKTFLGSITPSGGIVGKTDGVAVASGMVGEVVTVANNISFTGGVAYKDQSNVALSGSLAVVLSKQLNKGLYVVGYMTTCSISGATSLQGRLRIQSTGTALTNDIYNQSASGGVSITQPMIPIRIDTDGIILEVLEAAGGGPISSTAHEWSIIRII